MNLTRKIIIDTFLELCQTIPIEKVGIEFLMKKAGLSKPTFYHHFKDKYDLIAAIYIQDVTETAKSHKYLGGVEELVIGLRNLSSKKEFYKKALSMSGQNTLHETLHQYNMNYNCQALKKYLNTDHLSDELMYLLNYHSYGCIGYTIDWLKKDCPVSPEELAAVEYKYMPDILKQAWNREEG